MELDLDTANDIVMNKQNPQYQRYHGGDKAVNEAVTAAFLRHIPGNIDLADSTPEVLRGAPPEKPGNPQPGGEQAGAGEDPERAAAEKSLREHWGDQAQANVEVVSQWARSTIGEAGLESLHQKYPGLFNDAGVIKALHAALSR